MTLANSVPTASATKIPVNVASALKQQADPAPTPTDPTVEDKVEMFIGKAIPAIEAAIKPVTDLTNGIDLTLRANKGVSAALGGFAQQVHDTGAALHPFANYNEMTEAWLGATEFHRVTDTRVPAPLTPALTMKAVAEVCKNDYKIVHIAAPPDWRGQPQAPKYTQIRTDYNTTEQVPESLDYLLEDDKQNHLIVQVRGGQLAVVAHDDQKDLVDKFYDDTKKWMDKNNFYKNKVLTFDGGLDFMDGLKTKPTTWADIALEPGSEELIKSNTTDFFKNLDVYKKNGKFANRNLLLAGPPGTGKSMVNDILMNDLKDKATFIYVTAKSLGSAEGVAGIFDAARQMEPSVVVLEDLDMLGATGRDGNAKKGILNEMLNQVSGVFDNTGLVVVGSTNTATDFDDAMLRPLRFSTVVPMPLPDPDVRKQILQKITHGIKLDGDVKLEDIAAKTDKFSGAGLTELKEMAIQEAIEDHSFADGNKVLLKQEHFDKALETIHIKEKVLADGGLPTDAN